MADSPTNTPVDDPVTAPPPEPIFRLPDVIVHPTPLDAALAETPWHVVKTRVADARSQFGVDGSGVLVGIGDTGFDRVHCESGKLAGRVQGHHDFTGDGQFDKHGHGSHCAGDVLSMAPNASLLNVKCLNNRGAGDDSWLARSIRQATVAGCAIYNGSFGAPMPGQQTLAAIEFANAHGCICVIAGGNTGQARDVQWPARSEHCISVSPVDENDRVAVFGSMGPEIDVGAYGVKILSYGLNGGYAVMSGSSMAAPIFCGMLALRIDWEIKNGGRKTLTVADASAWLAKCCRDVGVPGRDDAFGYGLVDLMLAFGPKSESPPPAAPFPPDAGEGWSIPLPGGWGDLHFPARAGDTIGYSGPRAKELRALAELVREG